MDNVSKFVAQIQANIRDFERGIKKAQASANSMPDEIETEITANINDFRKGLLRAEAMAKAFSARDIEKKVKVDGSGFRNLYHSFKSNFTDPFNRRMGEIATNIRTMGTVFGNIIRGTMIGSLTALVPIIAGATSAVMALGNAIGVLAGGLIGTAGALAVAGAGVAAYGGLMASVLARYNDEAFQATAASETFTRSLEGLKSSWSGIVDSHMDAIFNQMATALDAANFGLQAMTPFIDGVVASMGGLIDRFHNFVTESTIMSDFFENMNTTGVKVFDNIANAAMSFTEGLFDSMNALMPLFDWVAQGLNNLAERFSSWAQTMAAENGFTKFINYVKENLPVIGEIFGNTFLGIIDLFAAFGANSSHVFDGLARMTERFREWAAALSENTAFQDFVTYIETHGPTVISLIGNIITTLVNLGIALAPLGAAVLNVVNSMFEFTSSFLQANPIVGQLIGVLTILAGAFMIAVPAITAVWTAIQGVLAPILAAITNFRNLASTVGVFKAIWLTLVGAFSIVGVAIGAIIGIISLLVSTFIYLWQTNEQFRERVIAIWTQIKEYLSQAITAISTFIKDIWGRLVQWWNVNNELIVTYLQNAWNRILTIIEVTMAILVPIVKVAWELIKNAIRVAMELILGIITTIMAVINGDWSAAWNTIKTTLVNIWNIMKEHIGNIVAIILPIILNFALKAYQWIKERFTQAKEFIVTVWNAIKEWIAQKAAEILTNIIQKFTEIKNNIQQKLEQAKQAAIRKFNEMKSRAQAIVQQIWFHIKNRFMQIKQTIEEKIQQAKTAAINKFNQMRSQVQSKVEQIRSNIQQKFQQIKTVIQQKIEQAKTALVNKFNQMKSQAQAKVQQILSDIKSKFEQIKSTIRNKIEQAKTALVNKFNQMKSQAQTKVQQIWSTIKSKFEQIKSTIQQKIEQAKTALVNKMTQMASKARQKAQEVYQNIKSKISEVPGMVGRLISKAAQAVANKASEFVSAGADLIAGLVQGIKNKAGDAINAAKSVVGDAISGAKNLLGINSPSRVFRDIGQYTSQGLAIGVKRDADRAVSEVTRMASDMTDAYKPEFNAINADVDKDINGINGRIRNTVDADITSGVETQRPIVNVKVENQGDVEMIRSAIYKEDSIEDSLAF